ncbi:MAG TPA: response regulator [Syntrophobacteria bacterium]|nr:response regulator [Syntrophobacteria bacterium]
MISIYVINGPRSDQFFEIDSHTIFVGRTEENDFQINDYSVSRKHLKIARNDNKYVVEDLGSSNGTWIDGDLIRPGEVHEVKEGVPIIIGDTAISLGKKCSKKDVATRYSIGLFGKKGESRNNFFYKDKRVTNRKNLELIYEISTFLMQSLDINDICAKMMDSLFSCFETMDSAAILLIDHKLGELKEILTKSRNNKETVKLNYSRTIVRRVIQEGKAIIMSDTHREAKERLSQTIVDSQIRSIMCVPFVFTSKVRGAVYVHSTSLSGGFKKEDLYLLTSLSTPAALAIENGLLYSEQKRTEKALREAQDELERRVHERTADLLRAKQQLENEIEERKRAEKERQELQAHLLEAQKMDAIATLAGGVAHQFNNALMGITGNIELLKRIDPKTDKMNHIFDSMYDSARRMAHLTDQLLAHARGGKYNPRTISLNECVKDTLPLISHAMAPSIQVYTDFADNISVVKADLTQIQIVLSAIIANATEAVEGRGHICITTRNERIEEESVKEHPGSEKGSYVCLEVEDNGKGMDEKTKARVFEPFFTTKLQGRGLGMAAVYGIVTNHNGWIELDSELGKGTVVRIYLPTVGLHVEETEKPKPEVVKGGGTILLIEDDETVMEVNRTILETLAYHVLEAKTGMQAITHAQTFDGDIDLAILDIGLPDMGGEKAYRHLIEARPNLKVIVCSGYAIDGPAQEILDAGAQGFIQKPYALATLSAKLKEVLTCAT